MTHIRNFLLSGFILLANFSFAQDQPITTDSTGLPGDNFSLQGALAMFKESSSLEDFEKKLNTTDNPVNNLDLNGDGNIDYIRVVDNMKENAHAIALQIPVNDKELQDVAVIEIEKNGDESAILQIMGDEDLYGVSELVEPYDEKEVIEKNANPQKGPSFMAEPTVARVIINVWAWPCVRYVYAPTYVVWVSPYQWNYYPVWFKPWRPQPWRYHYARCKPYRTYYHAAPVHRVVVAHNVYQPHRKTSVVVVNRNKVVVNNYRAKNTAPRYKTASNDQGRGSRTNTRESNQINNSNNSKQSPQNTNGRSGRTQRKTNPTPKKSYQNAPRREGRSSGKINNSNAGSKSSGGNRGAGRGRR